MPDREIHYFDSLIKHNDRQWYKREVCKGNTTTICGEKTPIYMYYEKNVDRIADAYPNVKWIIVLRDPVDRAYSQFQMNMRLRDAHMDSEATFEDEIMNEVPKTPAVDSEFPTYATIYKEYIQRGFYSDQINYLFSKFPRRNFHFIISEQMKDGTWDRKAMYDFLGVKDVELEVPKHDVNSATDEQKKEPMKPETRQCLQDVFKPYNEELFKMLGIQNPWKY
eukprot:CAMPEP_0170185030 /NCGR_PEP_ID=MMETSP0040_2-20121228/35390_1 /TAXON_ID=641309 /ORGANISM="Lotharella oceanica, Strain CCMP622" /LENGTH=221 /DNA_ID=CAMNT_0010431293 /DNA_START=57 /DNA_END=722 /DNA_ORIENTATION=+